MLRQEALPYTRALDLEYKGIFTGNKTLLRAAMKENYTTTATILLLL
jgi:hypothetical protein